MIWVLINIRELHAICLACLAFCARIPGKNLLVLTANIENVLYKQTGRGVFLPTVPGGNSALDLCIPNSIHLKLAYLPGEQNTLAGPWAGPSFLPMNGRYIQTWAGLPSSCGKLCKCTCSQQRSTENAICSTPRGVTALGLWWTLSCSHEPCVCLYSDNITTQSHIQGQARSCLPHTNSTSVASATLVLNPVSTVSEASSTAPIRFRPDFSGLWPSAPFQSAGHQLDGVDASWLAALEMTYLKNVQEVFLNSRKPWTRHTYLAKWKCCFIRSRQRSLSPGQASINHILAPATVMPWQFSLKYICDCNVPLCSE